MTNTAIDTYTFKLAEGVNEETFLTTTGAVKTFLSAQAGFVSRNLSKSEDGRWLDCITWKSMPDSLAASQVFMEEATVRPYLQSIDMSDIQIGRFETVTAEG